MRRTKLIRRRCAGSTASSAFEVQIVGTALSSNSRLRNTFDPARRPPPAVIGPRRQILHLVEQQQAVAAPREQPLRAAQRVEPLPAGRLLALVVVLAHRVQRRAGRRREGAGSSVFPVPGGPWMRMLTPFALVASAPRSRRTMRSAAAMLGEIVEPELRLLAHARERLDERPSSARHSPSARANLHRRTRSSPPGRRRRRATSPSPHRRRRRTRPAASAALGAGEPAEQGELSSPAAGRGGRGAGDPRQARERRRRSEQPRLEFVEVEQPRDRVGGAEHLRPRLVRVDGDGQPSQRGRVSTHRPRPLRVANSVSGHSQSRWSIAHSSVAAAALLAAADAVAQPANSSAAPEASRPWLVPAGLRGAQEARPEPVAVSIPLGCPPGPNPGRRASALGQENDGGERNVFPAAFADACIEQIVLRRYAAWDCRGERGGYARAA